MATKVTKHPDVIAWEKWKRGHASLFSDMATGEYLANRLWHAFMGGRESQRKDPIR